MTLSDCVIVCEFCWKYTISKVQILQDNWSAICLLTNPKEWEGLTFIRRWPFNHPWRQYSHLRLSINTSCMSYHVVILLSLHFLLLYNYLLPLLSCYPWISCYCIIISSSCYPVSNLSSNVAPGASLTWPDRNVHQPTTRRLKDANMLSKLYWLSRIA